MDGWMECDSIMAEQRALNGSVKMDRAQGDSLS